MTTHAEKMADFEMRIVQGYGKIYAKLDVATINPVIFALLAARAGGVRHSDIDWRVIRDQYDYTREIVNG